MSDTVFLLAGVLAGVFALLEIYPYVTSILGLDLRLKKMKEEDRTIPSLAGWTILSVEGFIVALSYYERQDYNDFWFFSGLTIEYLIVAVCAIWYGEHRITGKSPFSYFDYVCLAIAGASLIVWYKLGSWDIPIALTIVVDACGMAPILYKVWRLPRSESMQAWSMTIIGSVLGVVALGFFETWSFERSAFPIYMIIVNGLTMSLMLRRFTASRKGSKRPAN